MLKEQLKKDIVVAMKAKKKDERDLLRYVTSIINKREKDMSVELSDDDIIAVIKREIKETNDIRAISDSTDLKWRAEFLGRYLPEQLTESEIYAIVSEYKIGEPDKKIAFEFLMGRYGAYADKKTLAKTINNLYK